MADWDADDFEPDTAAGAVTTLPSDKWDGEDEEDDIKVIQSVLSNLQHVAPLHTQPDLGMFK